MHLGENMKFIHCSDLHLGSKIVGIPLDKSKYKREEVLCAFDNLCKYAVENNVTAVIISGDVFDTSKISSTIKDRFIHAISKAKDVDFLYLTGNHDEKIILSDYKDIPKNLKFFNDEWTYFKYENVCIAGVNFTTFNKEIIYDTLKLSDNDINIVSLHGQVVGYNSNDNAEVISLPKLKNKNIDYLALGHIHSYSCGDLDLRGKFAYSGCLEGRGFDETGEKGFVLLDVLGNKVNTNFVKFSSREFYELSFDITPFNNFFEVKDALISELKTKFLDKSLIKIILTGERDIESIFSIEELTKNLNEIFFFAKIYDKTVLRIDPKSFEGDKSIKGEFVSAVLDSDLDEETKKLIINKGLNLLRGKE